MEIVGAFACSHAGLIVTEYERADPGQRERIYDGFRQVGDAVRRLQPDAILIFATDHGRIYPLSAFPQFLIGVSANAQGIGDAGLPTCVVPINQRVAQGVLGGAIANGVDLAYSESMSIDHSFVTPLRLMTPEFDVPIVPVMQNCNRPPLPTLARSHEVGQRMAAGMRDGAPARVVAIGTGGLSHWVGDEARRAFIKQPAGTRLGHETQFPVKIGERGPINDAWDRAFLDALARGQALPFVSDYADTRLDEEAGNGAEEIRNWLLIAGLVGDARARTIAYEPIPEWHTGTAVVEFAVA